MPEMESVETVGAASRGAKLTKFNIQRNTCGPDDVTIDIKYVLNEFVTYMRSYANLNNARYCGICHTDTHFARDPMPMPVPFPLVPGHEIAGVVTKVWLDETSKKGHKDCTRSKLLPLRQGRQERQRLQSGRSRGRRVLRRLML